MDKNSQNLLIEQLDRKLAPFRVIEKSIIPQKGWINSIRSALKMSLRQLGERLNISPQSVKEIEEREAQGTITLKGLKEVALALDMKFVYGFVPKDESIEKMIEKRAIELATQIVSRTSQSMKLEDQENPKVRLEKSIKNKAEEIKSTMPKYLWD